MCLMTLIIILLEETKGKAIHNQFNTMHDNKACPKPFALKDKRKDTTTDTKETKRTKGSQEVLSKEDFEKVKKNNLCFICMGNHSKKDCP